MKKVLSCMMVGVLAISVSACNSQDKAKSTRKVSVSEVSDRLQAPITVKGVEYSNIKYVGGESDAQNTWSDLYKQNNINIETLYTVNTNVPNDYSNKLNQAVQAGKYPDILRVNGYYMQSVAKQGLITDMTDVFEKYASDELKEYIKSDGGMAYSSGMIDGRLYGIPVLEDTYKSAMVMYLRADWLEHLGLQIPTTMEELEKVAQAFTYNDPDGNGQNDTYGLALNGADVFSYYGGISAVFEAFGTVPAYYDQRYTFIKNKGELVWGGELTDEMKKGLTWLKDMYKKGGISSGFVVKNKDNIIGDINMGKCGIFFGTPDMIFNVAVDTAKYNPAARFISAAVPDENGSGKIYISNTPQYFNTVSSKCENPEGVIRLMNLSVQKLCNPSSKEEFEKYYGDGEKYTGYQCCLTPMLPVDKYYNAYLSLKDAFEKDSETALEQDNVFYQEYLRAYRMIKKYTNTQKQGGIDWSDKTVADGLRVYTMIGGKNSSYSVVESLIKKNHFNLSAYNGVMTEKMTQNYTALNKLTNNAVVKIICADDVGTYDAFLESWRQQGGAEIKEEAKQWYDSNGLSN